MFLAPVIPAKVAGEEAPPATFQAGCGTPVAPSGAHWFHRLDETTYAMNFTSFVRLQNDPYPTYGIGTNCTSATAHQALVTLTAAYSSILIYPAVKFKR